MWMSLTAEVGVEMRRWQDFNRRALRPPHEYTREHYGFAARGLQEQFREYREQFIQM